ncbi:MAG: hypothetical protein GY943_25950 [Chloroflexi bacterium]|nr:hypothetical protein [Chloroflexota bacterium]
MKTTNYFNTFIEIAEDCPAISGEFPPIRGAKKSIANLQFEMLHEHPYEFSSDDILFAIFATRKEISAEDLEEQRTRFFAKGQPCFRASPLAKRYGWGIHSNEDGKIAMVGVESEAYQKFSADNSIKKKKAMRSKKA